MSTAKYLENLKDSKDIVWNCFRQLLNSATKSTYNSKFVNGYLNSSIDYNSVLSKQCSYCDEAIEAIIEGRDNDAKTALTKVFFDSSGVLYDYVLTSGLYDLLAKEFKFETIPVSEIKKDQQLIIKDNRAIKSNQMTLEEIDECYDSINPIIDDSSSGETLKALQKETDPGTIDYKIQETQLDIVNNTCRI